MTTSMIRKAAVPRVRTAPTMRTVVLVSAAAIAVVGQLYATVGLIPALVSAFRTTTGAAAWGSTAFGFAYAIGMLVSGSVSDAFGRKRVVMIGLLASAGAALLVSVSSSFPMLIATRAVQGAVTAFFPTVMTAYLTERIVARRRSMAVTTFVAMFVAAATLAPMAAQALATIGGWRLWFYASAAALVVLAALLQKVMLPDAAGAGDRPRAGRAVMTSLAGVPALLRRPRLVALYLAGVGGMLAFVGITALVPLAGPGIAGHTAIMQVVRAVTLPAVAIVPLATPLLARIPARRRLVLALALLALSAIAIGLAPNAVAVAFALGALTIAITAASPALIEVIVATSPTQRRGAATGLYGFSLFVGAAVAAPTATAVAGGPFVLAGLGFAAVVVLAGVIAAFGARYGA